MFLIVSEICSEKDEVYFTKKLFENKTYHAYVSFYWRQNVFVIKCMDIEKEL